jgi:hypothetical protein
MKLVVFGRIGSDAGYWYIGADGKIHHQGGWEAGALTDVQASLSIIRAATQLKTPELAQSAIRSVLGFVQKELGEHVGEGTVILG